VRLQGLRQVEPPLEGVAVAEDGAVGQGGGVAAEEKREYGGERRVGGRLRVRGPARVQDRRPPAVVRRPKVHLR
jgi:hypothetical protein